MTANADTKKPKKAPKRVRKVKCSWCGAPFETSHPAKQFCTTAHGDAFANWCASRGKVLFPIAMAWRTMRGKKGTPGADAYAEMVRFLDQCAAELTEQGAPPIARHYADTRSTGTGITHWSEFPRRRPSRARPEPDRPQG